MRKKMLAFPYIFWVFIFTFVPTIIIFLFSVTSKQNFAEISWTFTFDNYKAFLDPIYLSVLGRSLLLSFYSTAICLLIGFPTAYFISKTPGRTQSILIMLIILPLWTNFLLRTYAWMVILRDQGLINNVLIFLGIIDEPLSLLYNNGAVIMGMVYNYFPFMVLPIYSVLIKIDPNVIEAAEDLGANASTVFKKVILPLSMPGIVSGIIMVFMPAISTFVVSDLLGGGQTIMLGNLIQNQFLMARNWQYGSAIAMILMIMIILSMTLLNKYQGKDTGGLF